MTNPLIFRAKPVIFRTSQVILKTNPVTCQVSVVIDHPASIMVMIANPWSKVGISRYPKTQVLTKDYRKTIKFCENSEESEMVLFKKRTDKNLNKKIFVNLSATIKHSLANRPYPANVRGW